MGKIEEEKGGKERVGWDQQKLYFHMRTSISGKTDVVVVGFYFFSFLFLLNSGKVPLLVRLKKGGLSACIENFFLDRGKGGGYGEGWGGDFEWGFFCPPFPKSLWGEMHVGVWAQNGSSFFLYFRVASTSFPPYIARQKEMEKKNFPIKTGVWSRRRVLLISRALSNPLRSRAPVPSFDIEVTSHLPRYEKRKENLIRPIFLRKIKILSCAKSRSLFEKNRHVGKRRMWRHFFSAAMN